MMSTLPAGGNDSYAVWYWCIARPICFMLLVHCMRRAASRAACTAGKQQRDQDRDDRDHDQEFDQRESPP